MTNRRNIIQPVELWAAAKEQMARDGETNMSKWIGECMLANLDPDLRETVPERRKVGEHTR